MASNIDFARLALAALVTAGLGYGGWSALGSRDIEAQSGGFLRDGAAGFVVTHFAYAVGPDAAEANSCPDGMASNMAEIYALTPEGMQQPGETDEAYTGRMQAAVTQRSKTADGRNFCAFPADAPFDPHARQMLAENVPADGIDLDGVISRSAADARAHRLDFTAPDGTQGVDNQFWRAVGCNRSYQSDGASNQYEIGMYAGEWTILIALGDVDDIANDDHVEIGIHAGADPLRLSPTRAALEFATYAMDPDPAFRATTTGSIVDGVVLSDPVDVQFHSVVNGMYLVRPLRDARIRATLSAEGVLDGILGGYTPVAGMYDFQFGYRNGKDGQGNPSDEARRLQSANGAARVLGHTCQGMWQSLHQLADGHRDADGHYTSISTQYRFTAQPAFIVTPEAAQGEDGENG